MEMVKTRSVSNILLIFILLSLISTACDRDPFTLAKKGPYTVSYQLFDYVDTSRNDRMIRIKVWYPAVLIEEEASNQSEINVNLLPDMSGAPYPLLLSSSQVANILAPYLVSRGFTWASIDRIGPYRLMDERMIDHPQDILFALNQMATDPPEGLEGIMDSDHAGVTGYSFDGYNSLVLSGARWDPQYYLAQCPTPDAITAPLVAALSAFDCAPANAWVDFSAYAGEAITTSEDGLWQALTDERIRAAMPMAGEGWWLFGERGLAAVDMPVLMIAGTEDELYPENGVIYEHLGTSDKAFISFLGREHMMITDEEDIPRIAHFMVAFFGYHLQGNAELADFYSQGFVSQVDDLYWGVYPGK
jgi:hypothetical protein